MKKYFRKGSMVLLKRLDVALEAERNSPMALSIARDMEKWFGEIVTVRYIDTDDTFTIEEDGGMYWYDTAWTCVLRQRSE